MHSLNKYVKGETDGKVGWEGWLSAIKELCKLAFSKVVVRAQGKHFES